MVFNSRERQYYITFLDFEGTTNPPPADAVTIPADACGTFHLPPACRPIDATTYVNPFSAFTAFRSSGGS